MATEATEVNVCNMALSYLGADMITALNDGSTRADLCDLFIDRCRDLVLEQREWTFAVEHVILDTAVTPAPTNPEWGVGFDQPSDCLRILTVHMSTDVSTDMLTNGMIQAEQIPWVLEEGVILCNFSEISVRYIKRITTYTEFSEGFVFALAARLAMDLAIPLTQSRELRNEMHGLYLQALREAASAEGLQGRSRRIRHRGLLAGR